MPFAVWIEYSILSGWKIAPVAFDLVVPFGWYDHCCKVFTTV
jgi:hypothetical protein